MYEQTNPSEKPSERQSIEESLEEKVKNILVVEDDPSNMLLIGLYLNKFETVDEAVIGEEAVKKTTQKNYDLILMDINLPEMNGDEVARLIRADNLNKHTPIIAVTAYEPHQFDMTHFDVYLGKPILRSDLYTAINEVINKQNK